MPAKKATRSTRSTRTTKASSSEAILDENVDLPSDTAEVKKKSSKSAAAPKKVLGERNAPNDNASSQLNESSSEPKSSSQKSSKSKKSTKKVASEQVREDAQPADSRATTPVPASPTKKRLPEDQVQAFLQNYDLEAQQRISRLRATLDISIQSSITRMRLVIDRIPRAVRDLSLADFIDEYGADIHAFMNRAPVQHLKDTQEEWDLIREERSPAKAKRSQKNDDTAKVDRNAKVARTATAAPKKKPTRSTRTADRSSSAIPTSPPSKPAPSLATFQPDLPAQTPKPRMARPGEVIQWQSINGSPICGVIGQDGRVVPVSFA
ncbi:conserved hypothetical protein [Sporisorium reilianum SRZ2]|uniref:Borealin N-terminal domain-containing protein n=1 Tax=Sporisorium reilianum (strain SRZ2) TaxID=999809 RepID=E6ZKD0_SPORE|nr:conserved hypothetical protein [Sporisorium reilianum SRZ2]